MKKIIEININELCEVKNITGLQTKIFYFMLQNMDYHNKVFYRRSAKEKFFKIHDTSNASFNNTIKSLIDSGLIGKLGKGEYLVNKKYAVRAK